MFTDALVPMVIETTGRGERAYDIYSLLLRERIIFLGTAIDDQIAGLIVAQMLYLDREDPEREISLYIQSPGGVVYAGLAIYDTMQVIRAPVSTIAVGSTASFGTVLLAAGTPGRRFALPHATIHIHQPAGGARGQASDIQIQAEEILGCAGCSTISWCSIQASRWSASRETPTATIIWMPSRPWNTAWLTR